MTTPTEQIQLSLAGNKTQRALVIAAFRNHISAKQALEEVTDSTTDSIIAQYTTSETALRNVLRSMASTVESNATTIGSAISAQQSGPGNGVHTISSLADWYTAIADSHQTPPHEPHLHPRRQPNIRLGKHTLPWFRHLGHGLPQDWRGTNLRRSGVLHHCATWL